MGKIKTFFYSLRRTFTSPAYYADILKAPFSFSLKYFYMFFFIYSLIFTSYITLKYFLPLDDIISFLPEKLAQVYPEELEIKIKKGGVSTNVTEPYRISLESIESILEESEEKILGKSTTTIEYLLVIDTKGKIDNFAKYQTYALLTKNHLSFINDEGNLETVSLEEIGDLTINQKLVQDIINLITPYLKFVLPLLVVGTFFLFFVFYPTPMLLYLLFMSLILLIIAKVVAFPLSYKKSYQMGLHLITISTTFFSITKLVGLTLRIQFLRTMLLGVIGLVILKKIKDLQTPLPTTPEESTSPS